MLRLATLILVILVSPGIARAHHSVAGFFDTANQVEIEGVIQKVRWRNPHTVFLVDVTDASGEVTSWTIESGALGVLRSRGLAREFVQPGDEVKILGDSSLRSRPEMFARNMLLASGKEVMLTAGSVPYFSSGNRGGMLEAEFDQDLIDAAIASADGIFRVWTTDIEQRPIPGVRLLDGAQPLTAAAAALRAEYDASDEALLGCTGWSMPRIMSNPLPMEFVRDGEQIIQRFEENDSVRVIHMNAKLPDGPGELTTFGFSAGRWDGSALVVETIGVLPDRLNNTGTPFSAQMRLLEHFTPSEDGSRLSYRLRVEDPITFTEPFEVGRHWDWRPEIPVADYECQQDQELQQ
jgi:hypothetical protein